MMKKFHWKPYVFFILATQAVGGLSGFLTREGMKQVGQLPQSALTPPAIVFPIAWAVLYTLMAIGAARVWQKEPGEERTKGLWLYVFQLIFNFFWSLFYFNMQAFSFSLAWLAVLWLLILLMTLSFRRLDKWAAWLQLPYLLWVAFAGYLNYVMWRLN